MGGRYYTISRSILQHTSFEDRAQTGTKSPIPIYLGSFVPSMFVRIAQYADGWLAGPIDFLEKGVKSLNEQALKMKSGKDLRYSVLTFPQSVTGSSSTSNSKNNKPRFPLSGSIDLIGKV